LSGISISKVSNLKGL